jgi:hypothetical protein
MSTDENFLFGDSLNKGNSFALSEPELAGWLWQGMTHENPSRRMTKMLPSSSNLVLIYPKLGIVKSKLNSIKR